MRYCAGIIAYKPSVTDVENIRNYASIVEQVFVYDNTVEARSQNSDALTNVVNNISILGDGNNNGLSIACSELCMNARQKGFDYIILFDQDSRIDSDSIKQLAETCEKNVEAAIVCPQIVYQGKTAVKENAIKEVSWCITSGSMVNIKYFGTRWNFDENYFIDRVDVDCCKQIQLAGLKILMDYKSILYQELGTSIKRGRKIVTTHSPLRHYYMFRNRLYYNNKFKISLVTSIFQIVRHLCFILLWEQERMKKLSESFRGIKDYYCHRMGKSS